MSGISNSVNGVNGARTVSNGSSLGRCPVVQQHGPGRHPATADQDQNQRILWSKETSRVVMECYIRSNTELRGYRKGMRQLWIDKGMFEVKEQRLADQIRQI